MALTTDVKLDTKQDAEKKEVVLDVVGDSSYPSGGYEVDFEEDFAMTKVFFCKPFPCRTSDTPERQIIVQPVDGDESKVMVRVFDAAGTTEVSPGTDLTDLNFKLYALGLFRR